MSFASDLKIVAALVTPRPRASSHAEELDLFYRSQAETYDTFRERLLPGRRELMRYLATTVIPQGVWFDVGGGTGAALEMEPEWTRAWDKVVVVDLSSSLLSIANDRIQRGSFVNASTHLHDATLPFCLPGGAALITFHYSLTMIPDWIGALDIAERSLAPGGVLGVVDFTISPPRAPQGQRQRSPLARHLWRAWFSYDGVYLHEDLLSVLQKRFATTRIEEGKHRLPFLCGLKAPWCSFVGSLRPDD